MKTSIKFSLLVIVVILFIASCCTSCMPEVLPVDVSIIDAPSTFWGGLWHGIISPFSFLISLFTDHITVYNCNNNGNWYNFGFVLGAGILFGGTRRW